MTLSVTIKEQQSIQINKLFEYDLSGLRQDMGWQYLQDNIWEFFLNQYVLAFSKDTIRQYQYQENRNTSNALYSVNDKEFHLEMSQNQQQISLKLVATNHEVISQINQDFLDNLLLLGHHYLDNIPEITSAGFTLFLNHHAVELNTLNLDEEQLEQVYLWHYLLNENMGYFKDLVNSYESLIHYIKVDSHLPPLTDEQQKIITSYHKI
jgi:hypothetical protein